MPFYLWKDEVLKAVTAAGKLPDRDWFERQQWRVARAYDLGETIADCADFIGAFGEGEIHNRLLRRTRSPRSYAL